MTLNLGQNGRNLRFDPQTLYGNVASDPPFMSKETLWRCLAALLALLLGIALLLPLEQGSAILRRAYLAEQRGDFKTAARFYTQASRIFSWDRAGLRVKAAQNAARAEEHSLVIHLLSPLQEEGLLPHPAQILLAKAYLATQQADAAMALRREWVEKGYPTDVIDPELVEFYTEQGRFEHALPILRTLAASQPQNPEWHYRLGLLLAAERPQEAAPSLRRAVELEASYEPKVSVLLEQLNQPAPEAVLAHLYGGRGLAAIGEWRLAERAFAHAVERRPDFAEAWAYLGLARFHLAQPPPKLPLPTQASDEESRTQHHRSERPGLTELRFALKLNPRSQIALAFLTLYWQEQGEAQRALQSAQQAFELYPDELPVRLQYAQALAQSGDLAGGWRILNEWIPNSPEPIAARKALVLYCVQYGYRLSESALPLAQELEREAPRDVEALDLLGQVYLGLAEWTLAQQTFERALSLDAKYAPALLHLGIAHLEQGNTSLAHTYFQKVIELVPFSSSGEQAKRYLEVYLP
ncbi:MAG: tetratricopeptide repeat protein [Anaerolineales bacterium]|nr:tetratricopeptide repeat protein [Anaerolineales bacterium]MDW8161408.1 tetratricopeptide repeat protein [Anaerolineales bacterium]